MPQYSRSLKYIANKKTFFQKFNVTKESYKKRGHFLGNATIETSANAKTIYDDVSRTIEICSQCDKYNYHFRGNFKVTWNLTEVVKSILVSETTRDLVIPLDFSDIKEEVNMTHVMKYLASFLFKLIVF